MQKTLLATVALVTAVVANNAVAGLDTWDPQGASGNAVGGTWENVSWDTGNQLGTNNLSHFIEGDAANFAFGALGGSASTFTITMNSTHTVAGMFNGPLTPKSCYVTIAGTGSIVLPAAIEGFDTGGSTLGETIIDVPIGGPAGGIVVLEGAGQIFLNGISTYASGTDLGYSGASFTGIVNFSNSASFGTGVINISNSSGASMVVDVSTPVTIPNPVLVNAEGANTSLNIVGNAAGVTFSGNWSLGTNTPKIGSSSTSVTSLDIFSGVISGTTGGFIAWSTGGGTLEFNNAMTYTGATTISNIVTLALGPNGAIGNSAVTVQTNATLADTNVSGTNTIAGSVTFQAANGTGRAAAQAIFNGSGTSVGRISVGGSLTLATTPIVIHVSGSPLLAGSYRLISCTGTVTGSASTTPTITGLALPAGDTAAISTTTGAGGHVDLVITDPHPPSAGPFAIEPVEGIAETVSASKILSVASNPQNGTLSILSVASPTTNGATVTLTNGTLVYTSAANLNTDTINYVLGDGYGTASGTISVTVTGNGTGNNDLTVTPSGGGVIVQAFGIPGQSYYIQVASSVTGPWTDLPGTPVTANSLGQISYTVSDPTSPSYYRTSTTP